MTGRLDPGKINVDVIFYPGKSPASINFLRKKNLDKDGEFLKRELWFSFG